MPLAFGHLCGDFHKGQIEIMKPALSRRGAVEPFHAMDILAGANRLRQAGHDVISMAVGQPSDPAPSVVREAAAAAVRAGRIGYTDALGLMSLRRAIADHYASHYGVEVPVERIAVTTGSSAAFNLAFLAMFDQGDRVAITVPGYPAYRNIMGALGLDVVEIPLGDEGYLTAEALEASHRQAPLKGLLFASPANPTGAAIPPVELANLLSFARDSGIEIISDEIYHRLDYSGDDVTALSIDPNVTIINSFSKYYCMTGWRIGWMVLPEASVRQIERLAQSLYISAPELSQIAASHAFEATDELEIVKKRYMENRAFLMQRLPALGFPLLAPMDGAFYAYCDVTRHTNDSMEFAQQMLTDAHVAAPPGRDFDPYEGHRSMRFSYAGSLADMQEATRRIEAWLQRR